MWRSCNEWSQADKDKYNKEAKKKQIKCEEKKTKRKDEKKSLMILTLKKNKAKINQSTTNGNQSSNSKLAQM